MKPALKKTFSAILIALASLVIVISIASLAMVQDGTSILRGQDKATPTPTQDSGVGSGSSGSNDSNEPTKNSSIATDSNATDQSATPPSPLSCTTPDGWMPIIVMPGQTLDEIAAQYKTSPEMLKEGNCLVDDTVQAGTIIFVPVAVANQTSAQCGPPAGWVIYYVQPGDTLFGIATMTGTTVNQLMVANCLKSAYVYTGQRLYTPPYYVYPIQPIWTPEPTWITFPMLMTPQPPITLPTGEYHLPP